MSTLLHVTGDGKEPLPPFAGHLVKNLEWHRYTADAVDSGVDTVVASPVTPADAVQLVARLRDAGQEQRVVLVVDSWPGWHSVAGAFDAVSLVSSLDDLRTLLDDPAPGEPGEPGLPSPDHDRDPDHGRPQVPRGGSRGMLMARLGDQAGQLAGHDDAAVWASLAEDEVGGTNDRARVGWFHDLSDDRLVGTSVSPDEPEHTTVVVEPPRPRGETTALGGRGDSRTGRQHDPTARRQRREHEDPDRLVAALLGAADRLYSVRETGTAVAGHVKELVGVDAVAVLVPDGAVWTVVGAVGHRHLEERLLLGPDHWLVREVTQGRHGVVVEDTDIARTRLAGAPLAAWPHLLACPVPPVHGLVVMARSDNGPAFSSRDLAHASHALDEAGELFVSALAVRELARRLRRHAELDDPLD